MRAALATLGLAALGLGAAAGPAAAQTAAGAECAQLRHQLASHAELSEGVRKALAAQVARYPTARTPVTALPSAAPSGARADTIRARLAQIPAERQRLEEQRLGAIVRFDLTRANQAQAQIQALDQEKAGLERELAGLPSGTAMPAPSTPTPAPDVAGTDADRIRCEEVRATLDSAVRTRQRELGAREGQPGVIPLTPLRGQSSDEIARTLAGQFAAWPAAASQLGLFDANGDARIDGFVDVPADGVYRLYRQRADGSVSVEVFALPGRAAPSEIARRLEEETIRRTGRTLPDLVGSWPAGSVRTLGETTAFGAARARYVAGEYADAGRLPDVAARAIEYPNLRGENVRLLEVFSPVPGGVAVRRVLVVQRSGDQELWEESTTMVRPASYWRTDVEVGLLRQLRTVAGAAVGAPTAAGPTKFSLER